MKSNSSSVWRCVAEDAWPSPPVWTEVPEKPPRRTYHRKHVTSETSEQITFGQNVKLHSTVWKHFYWNLLNPIIYGHNVEYWIVKLRLVWAHLHFREYILPTSFTRLVSGGLGTKDGMFPVREGFEASVSSDVFSGWEECFGGRRSHPYTR